MEVLNDLLGYTNIKIYQNTEMFSFSLDSVLLANYVEIKRNVNKILDIGTGNAPIPLILSTKTDAQIDAVEIQKEVYELGLKSIIYNNLQEKINIINDDICRLYKNMENETYDVITCNPPFFPVSEDTKFSNSEYKKIARHEIFLDIDRLVVIAKKLLKNNGSLYIVHRPERLCEFLEKLENNGLQPKRLKFIHPKVNLDANIVLIEAVKMGKKGLKIDFPIITHKMDGSYTDEILKIFS